VPVTPASAARLLSEGQEPSEEGGGRHGHMLEEYARNSSADSNDEFRNTQEVCSDEANLYQRSGQAEHVRRLSHLQETSPLSKPLAARRRHIYRLQTISI
jgi:hypothetical protein